MTKKIEEKKTKVKAKVTKKVGNHLVVNGVNHSPGDVIDLSVTASGLERLKSNPLLEIVK